MPPRVVHFPAICCPKKRWWGLTSNKSESSEQVYKKRAFQDGRFPHHQRFSETRRLDGKSGSERCLLLNTGFERSEISALSVQGSVDTLINCYDCYGEHVRFMPSLTKLIVNIQFICNLFEPTTTVGIILFV